MNNKEKPLWHGIALVAGGAIGAGMFALPVVSAGAWFGWSILGLLVTCVLTVMAALVLLEVNQEFEPGASFHTVVNGIHGAKIAWINNACIAFIMFILMYAYTTAGASILSYSLNSVFDSDLSSSRSALSVIFAVIIGLIVWLGTSVVSRMMMFLIGGLVISFVIAIVTLSGVESARSLRLEKEQLDFFKYVWAALPVYVTAFACAGLVPSLIKHYPNQPSKSRISLKAGCSLVLLTYIVWILATFAALPRPEFVGVINQGGNIGSLVAALRGAGANPSLGVTLDWFSHFAIITSFLGVGLGLFHFIGDALSLNATKVGRLTSVSLAFCPPALMSYFFPYGFISAISLAGLLVALSFFVLPATMNIKRFGWKISSGSVLAFGILIAALKILLLFNVLKSFAL